MLEYINANAAQNVKPCQNYNDYEAYLNDWYQSGWTENTAEFGSFLLSSESISIVVSEMTGLGSLSKACGTVELSASTAIMVLVDMVLHNIILLFVVQNISHIFTI